ncbi:unnamed protein product [Heligmosomoides polygyrus]|uniref:F-box domain-containing protein n=1 Tax=Heligmosomoides polygyrus TaxID=6339 RepID=A0A3P8CJW6_HELPZ|nr:unnamed protein product [Heligmosomoides polygyrus]
MSLIPLTVYDNLRRVCCSMFASSSQTDHYADVLRWRSVSRRFRAAAVRRLERFTTIHIRVYDGLCKLYERGSSTAMTDELSWHPAGCLLLNEMSTSELGIALDARPKWKDVKVLLALLQLLRENVVHIHMDSPVVELLVKEVNTKKINALLVFFSQNRKCDADFTCEETTIAPVMKSQLPLGPMFPALKQFVVTSNVVLGESWCRSKQRLFRHVNSFKQWSDASSLGVRYLQQFHGAEKRRCKNKC